MSAQKTKTKLLHFLSKIPAKKRAEFRDFLRSPYFNKQEEVIKIFDVYLATCLKGKAEEPSETELFAILFPSTSFNLNRIRKMKRLLVELVVEYLTLSEFRKEPGQQGLMLLQKFNQQGETSYFDQYYQRTEKAIQAAGHSQESLMKTFLLKKEQYIHRQTHKPRSGDLHFEEVLDAVEMNVLAQLLMYNYALENQIQVLGTGEDLRKKWVGTLIGSLSDSWSSLSPLPRLWYVLNHTLLQPDQEGLARLKTEVMAQLIHIDPIAADDIFTATLNNYYRHHHLKGEALQREIFELYQEMINSLILDKRVPISASHYKNIVSIGARLKEFKWLTTFIEEVNPLLNTPKAEREAIREYNFAILDFHQFQFQSAEVRLHKALPDLGDIFYQLDSRLFLLMCYYENRHVQGMESLAHSFRMFIRSNKQLSPDHKKRYLDFIRIYRRLIGLAPGNRKKIELLFAETETLNFRTGQTWLKEKLDQLN